MIYSIRLASYGVHEDKKYTASIEECQGCVSDYVNQNNVTANNWTGGEVFDGLGNLIGKITYNGIFKTMDE